MGAEVHRHHPGRIQREGDLESDGLVERHPDPGDGRRALVSLTEAGSTELREDRLCREGWLVKAIEELPAEDRATVERAIVLLRHLADTKV
jgi:DNA-binding MarR family transcriptional regulator